VLRPSRIGLVLLFFSFAGCGEQGSYQLHWTLGCAKIGELTPACQIQSARDCSRAGLDALEVLAVHSPTDTPTRTQLACYAPGEGPTGRGPGLDEGRVSLQVYGISPGGQRLIGPIPAEAEIPGSGFAAVEINLPLPAQCGDGVDNDGDGLVDLHDPGCQDVADTSEE
jgi:hypothetical protein